MFIFLKLSLLLIINTVLEFLPVSSTTHFKLISSLLNININEDLILSFAQLAITLYMFLYFKKEIFEILKNVYKKKYIFFSFKIVLTMIPTAIFGFFFYGLIKEYKTINISLFLILGSLLMLYAEKKYKNNSDKKINNFYEISVLDCLRIGFLQMLSMLTGFSRSASTISGGLLSNFTRKNAVLFSFFISIPIGLVSSFFEIYKNYSEIQENYKIIIFTFILTILLSCIFVKKIILFLQNKKLNTFIYYRIILALLIFVYNYGVF